MTSVLQPAPVPSLVVRTTAIDDPGSLLGLLPDDEPLAWVRREEGLAGWGVAVRTDVSGPDRFAEAESWWRDITGHAVVRDDISLPGTGLMCFGSFAFADAPGDSVLVVPEIVVGHRRRGEHSTWWVTTVTVGGLEQVPHVRPADEPPPPVGLRFADGAMSGARWESQVDEAVRRITQSPLEKVVLARDLIALTDDRIDVRWPVRRLAETYPSCWTFHVDGLFGATPEMLVRRERGLVTSRVLAGTIQRTGDDDHDLALAGALARSSKDLEEHEYAVRSVADALEPHCTSMNVPESPFVLHLPNVMHLASDVAGVIDSAAAQPGSTSLGLAAALHPSAAVGGTPTELAVDTIAELEQMQRGRYAGPVGWMDATGDGEWGIALRCGLVDGSRVRLFAGCGIVAGSVAEAELAEAQAKFVPVRDALAD